jgi:hypothetical protein
VKFERVQLATLLTELSELTADWADEAAREMLIGINATVSHLRGLRRRPTLQDLETMFRDDANMLDVCRLFIGKGQEPVAHTVCHELGISSCGWSRLRILGRKDAQKMASAMDALGVPALIEQHLQKQWQTEDVLIERYKLGRGRAISGQNRGRGLENEVEKILMTLQIPFQPRVTFIGRENRTAKCDIAIPSKDHPLIVIESKGFEATGSKLTDFLGDIMKILDAKDFHMYFFVVTDGRGWRNRQSDLKKIIEQLHSGRIEMIYTRARLAELSADIKRIYELESSI